MSRYVIRPGPLASYDEPEPLLAGVTVYEPPAIPTGLVDPHGRPIMRRTMDPIGFRHPLDVDRER